MDPHPHGTWQMQANSQCAILKQITSSNKLMSMDPIWVFCSSTACTSRGATSTWYSTAIRTSKTQSTMQCNRPVELVHVPRTQNRTSRCYHAVMFPKKLVLTYLQNGIRPAPLGGFSWRGGGSDAAWWAASHVAPGIPKAMTGSLHLAAVWCGLQTCSLCEQQWGASHPLSNSGMPAACSKDALNWNSWTSYM